jgi:Mlc titration factor MtfA (ptsG expression regulator)
VFILKKRRRQRLREEPFSPEWLAILKRNVAYYHMLPPDDQRDLQGLIQIFVAEKCFEGCGGLTITDEIRLSIAAQACILLLHRDTDFYPMLQSILVYPTAYLSPAAHYQADGVVVEGTQARLGESWARGVVVLSWDDVKRGAGDVHDGHNVVFHEFAHQLDYESGAAEGAPALPRRSQYIAWARVLAHEYGLLVRDIACHRQTLLDRYGATNPAEFFAVATECFFEKPLELKIRHPGLYEQLQLFYRQDPATYYDKAKPPGSLRAP